MRRRFFLATTLSILPALATAAPIVEVSKDVFLLSGAYPRGAQPDGNSVIFLVNDGVVVVDSGRHAAHTQQIIDFAHSRRRSPIAVINTHWHLDHSGGNVLLRKLFPTLTVYATDAGREAQAGFLQNYKSQLQAATEGAKPGEDVAAWRAELNLIAASQQRLPDKVIESSDDITIAGRTFTLHSDRGATAGDLWIEDRASSVVAVGDLVTFPVPFFDTACPQEWAEALGHIAATSFKTLIPGHGEAMNKEQFLAYREAYTRLLACAHSNRPSSQCFGGWTDFAKGFVEPHDLDRIDPMLDYYFKAILRAPLDQRSRYCTSRVAPK